MKTKHIHIKEIVLKAFTLLFALSFAISACISGTYAWESKQQTINEALTNADDLTTVELLKLEKPEKAGNSFAKEIPIPNTVFYLYNSAGKLMYKNGSCRFVTDENGKITVKLQAGKYRFVEVSPSIGYTYDVDENGDTITEYEFTVEKPQDKKENQTDNTNSSEKSESTDSESADKQGESTSSESTDKQGESTSSDKENKITIKAYNLRLKGDLIIRKTVENADGSPLTDEQKQTTFKFYVTFSDLSNRYDHYEYSIDGGETFSFSSGDYIELCDGQSAVFEELPAGILYNVVEENAAGYLTESMGHRGNIREDETSVAYFTNTFTGESQEPPAEEETQILSVTKRLDGVLIDSDKSKEFNMVLYYYAEDESGRKTRIPIDFALKADETKDFEIPVGAYYEVNEDNYLDEGFSQSTINCCGIMPSRPVSAIVTNTYVGEDRVEIKGEKTWDMGENTDIAKPESITLRLKNGDLTVAEKVVKPKEVKYTDDSTENDYDGSNTGGASGGNAEENIGGNNAGDDEIKVKEVWEYSFVMPKYNADGTKAEYTLTEKSMESYRASYDIENIEPSEDDADDPDSRYTYMRYDIKNTYVAPIEMDPPIISKKVEGSSAPKTTFEFVFEGKSGTPMPEGSDGNQKLLKIEGGGELEIGTLKFTEAGEYVYSVYESNGGKSGWKYDTAVYTITFKVTEKDGKLSCERTILKNSKETKDLEFVNKYSKPSHSNYTTVSGSKTWIHGDNPKSEQPSSITVYVYADGKLAAQRLVTAADKWKYSFTMPKYGTNGRITYTIDEADVKGYSKEVKGYDLTNTYVGDKNDSDNSGSNGDPNDPNNPDNPNSKDDPSGKDDSGSSDKPNGGSSNGGNSGSGSSGGSSGGSTGKGHGSGAPKTGDSSDLSVWMLIMFFNLTGLMLLLAIAKLKYGESKGEKPKTQSESQ